MKIFRKLKNARKLLDLTQQQVASHSGVAQKDISQLESGDKKFIPIEYIQFMNKMGVYLNSIFDDNIDEVGFTDRAPRVITSNDLTTDFLSLLKEDRPVYHEGSARIYFSFPIDKATMSVLYDLKRDIEDVKERLKKAGF